MPQPTQDQYLNVLRAMKFAYEKSQDQTEKDGLRNMMTSFRKSINSLFGPGADAAVPADKMYADLGVAVDWSGLNKFASELAATSPSGTVEQWQVNLGRFVQAKAPGWEKLGATPVSGIEQQSMKNYVGDITSKVTQAGKPINPPTTIKTSSGTQVTIPSAIPTEQQKADLATAEQVINAGLPDNKWTPEQVAEVQMPGGTPPASNYFGQQGGKGPSTTGGPPALSNTGNETVVTPTGTGNQGPTGAENPEPAVDTVARDWKPGQDIPAGYFASADGKTISKTPPATDQSASGTGTETTAMDRLVQSEYFKNNDFDGYLLSKNPMWKQYAVTDPVTGKVTLDKSKIKASGDSQVYQTGLGLWNEIIRLNDSKLTGTSADQVINSPYYKAQSQAIDIEIDGAIKAMNIKLGGEIAALEGQGENIKTNTKYALEQLQRELGVTNWTSRQSMGVSGVMNTGMLAYVYGQAAGNTAMQTGKITELSYNDLNSIANQIAILEKGKTQFASDQELLRDANKSLALLKLVDPTNEKVAAVAEAMGKAVSSLETLSVTGNLVAQPINTEEERATETYNLNNATTIATIQSQTGLKIVKNADGTFTTVEEPTAMQIGQMEANGFGWDKATKSWVEKPTSVTRQAWAKEGYFWNDETGEVYYDMTKDVDRMDALRDAGWLEADGKTIRKDYMSNPVKRAQLLASGVGFKADGTPYLVVTPELAETIRNNKADLALGYKQLDAQMTAAGWTKDAKTGKWKYTGEGQAPAAGTGPASYIGSDQEASDLKVLSSTGTTRSQKQAAIISLTLGRGEIPGDDASFINLLSGADTVGWDDWWTKITKKYSYHEVSDQKGILSWDDEAVTKFLTTIGGTNRGIEATILYGVQNGDYESWIDGMWDMAGLEPDGKTPQYEYNEEGNPDSGYKLDSKGNKIPEPNLFKTLKLDEKEIAAFFNRVYKAGEADWRTYTGDSFKHRLPWGPVSGY